MIQLQVNWLLLYCKAMEHILFQKVNSSFAMHNAVHILKRPYYIILDRVGTFMRIGKVKLIPIV